MHEKDSVRIAGNPSQVENSRGVVMSVVTSCSHFSGVS